MPSNGASSMTMSNNLQPHDQVKTDLQTREGGENSASGPPLDPTKCNAHKRQTEGLCGNVAGYKTNHVGVGRCSLHGGKTVTHVKAAEIEIARLEAHRLGIPVEVDPITGLKAALWSAYGSLIYYQEKAQSEPTVIDEQGPGGALKQVASPWVVLLHEAERTLAQVSKAAIAAGLKEREIRLAESDALTIFAAINRTLQAIGLEAKSLEFSQVFRVELSKAVRP